MKNFKGMIFIVCGMGILLLAGCGSDSYLTTAQDASVSDVTEESDGTFSEDATTIYVQVSGAVKNPGVYEMAADARAFEAIEAAGGFTEEADLEGINQAAKLSDAEQLYVRTYEERAMEEAAGEAGEADDGKVNINTATAAQLMSLSGIGQSKADSIVKYREEHGLFSSTEEIMQVEGIKEGTYSKISDQIKI